MNILDENLPEKQYPQFDTAAKRMGTVARVSPSGLTVWRINAAQEMQIGWVRLH